MAVPTKLKVVWTSGDRDVAIRMVFMYTYNAKVQNWWEEVELVVWGHSAQLLSVDTEVGNYALKMMKDGVKVVACKACADSYGVSDVLAKMGVEVKYMGQPLTEYLKDEACRVVTF
jgi:hypothetical protein